MSQCVLDKVVTIHEAINEAIDRFDEAVGIIAYCCPEKHYDHQRFLEVLTKDYHGVVVDVADISGMEARLRNKQNCIAVISGDDTYNNAAKGYITAFKKAGVKSICVFDITPSKLSSSERANLCNYHNIWRLNYDDCIKMIVTIPEEQLTRWS